jgi:phenylacetic acid degradation operon negative regulatory protein
MSDVSTTSYDGDERLGARSQEGTQVSLPEMHSAVFDGRPWSDAGRPRDIALDLFASYVRHNHPMVWSGGLVELLTEFGFALPASRIALSRLVDKGLITRVRQGRFVHYMITGRGELLLTEGDRRIFGLGFNVDPVERWTLLMHTIPPEMRPDRGRLGRRLRFQGFGRLQDRIWIAPYDRRALLGELLLGLGIREHVAVLVGRPAPNVGVNAFLDRAWDLRLLADRYAAFAATYLPYVKVAERAALSDRQAFVLRTVLVHSFRGFADQDPDLPEEMLPDPGARRVAIEVFRTVYDGLAVPAQRHFDAVCNAWFQSPGMVDSRAKGSES